MDLIESLNNGLIAYICILCMQLLGDDIDLNCQEMDLIDLLERSFSRSERSNLAHFPIMPYKWFCQNFYLPRRRRPGTGDIAMPPVCPSVCLSIRLSVCPSITFLETLQVRAPCHGGVLYSF